MFDRAKELGEAFHYQLAQQIEEPNHPDDPGHDLAVGQALIIAVNYHSPQLAMDIYNSWAREHGYQEIFYLGCFVNPLGVMELMIDIETATVSIFPDFSLKVVKR